MFESYAVVATDKSGRVLQRVAGSCGLPPFWPTGRVQAFKVKSSKIKVFDFIAVLSHAVKQCG